MIPISPLSTISARAMSGRNPEDDVAMSSGRAGYIASYVPRKMSSTRVGVITGVEDKPEGDAGSRAR